MSPNEPDRPRDPSRRNLSVLTSIMLATIAIGGFLAWDSGNNETLYTWLAVGITLSIVYLLYQIATNVEKLRVET